jgi:hypothetical protein
MSNALQAIQLISAALKVAAEITESAVAIQATITRARAEGRDITDEELAGARAQSALADARFETAMAAGD